MNKTFLSFTQITNCFHFVGCKPSERVDNLVGQMLLSGIDNKLRVAHFIGQICHESNYLQYTSENLNYSVTGLLKVFPKYFNEQLAKEYQYQPEKIASRVYANRMGNGDEKSKDGWKFRGRTEIQLTGKWNYTQYSRKIFGDDRLVTSPEIVNDLDVSSKIVCLFWTDRGCNAVADRDDILNLTKIINGGRNGLAHREAIYKQALKVLNG